MKLAWSKLAVDELHAVRVYSIERWGRAVALRYLSDVRDAANRVAAQPDRARQVKGPFRLVRVRSHCLIVHVDTAADRVTVARVLHMAMDLERHLPPD